MENCKPKRCRTRPPVTVMVTGKPNIKNMPKRDYDIFVGAIVEMIRDDITNTSPFIAKEEDSHD